MASIRQGYHKRGRDENSTVLRPWKRTTPTAKLERELRVVNCVCVADMAPIDPVYKSLDLMLLADILCGRYAETGFQCITTRCINPNVITHTFSTFVVIACGASDEVSALKTIKRIQLRIRNEMYIRTKLSRFATSNVVAAMATGYRIDLQKFHDEHNINGKSNFDEERYPAVQFYPNFPIRCPAAIIHRSGTVNIVGARNLAHAASVIAMLQLELYRVDNELQLRPPPNVWGYSTEAADIIKASELVKGNAEISLTSTQIPIMKKTIHKLKDKHDLPASMLMGESKIERKITVEVGSSDDVGDNNIMLVPQSLLTIDDNTNEIVYDAAIASLFDYDLGAAANAPAAAAAAPPAFCGNMS